MPAWRSASPKKWNTRPLKTSPKARPQKRMMSPREAIQSLGTTSQLIREPVDWGPRRAGPGAGAVGAAI